MLEPLDFAGHARAFISRREVVGVARDHFEWTVDDGDPYPFLSDWVEAADTRYGRIAALVQILTHLPKPTLKRWAEALLGDAETTRSSLVMDVALCYVLDWDEDDEDDDAACDDEDDDEAVDDWWRPIAAGRKGPYAGGLPELQRARRERVDRVMDRLVADKEAGRLKAS